MENSAHVFGTRRSPSTDTTGDERRNERFYSPAETLNDRAAALSLPSNVSPGRRSERTKVEVVVNPVRNRDGYIDVPKEYVIKRVTKGLGVFDGVSYHQVVLGTGLRVGVRTWAETITCSDPRTLPNLMHGWLLACYDPGPLFHLTMQLLLY